MVGAAPPSTSTQTPRRPSGEGRRGASLRASERHGTVPLELVVELGKRQRREGKVALDGQLLRDSEIGRCATREVAGGVGRREGVARP